ncbi:hypothetical protein SERLA73DRAFT_189563 [Serpula lacrymans var. lacrymans S7.3]|uniref:DUF6534 domain-containing protein n=2 Tax=Serpula lacrymans var. lacrymans TaxID=341189 RepID=F8QDY3_SERL3|nr:uncharacterized protein SERLADRAFT_480411 [Serpula lacrymans var. lacrymans S7.9]EGN93358.1 hypothetical protein SERLA73DRAFT_189563 [Serpula lacrymans var. lacrymans S7.3]EGO18739.1 hypothetical protein SERLADRAFT_480411 [Serpula lacrymans var. lacrymans S7.9]
MMAEICISIPTACDIIATIAMWYFLDSVGSGFKKTDSTVKFLKFLILNRGLLLVSTQGAMLTLWVAAQESWYWLPFHMNTVNIYVNTTLVMFNERANIPKKEKKIGTMSFQLATCNQLSLRFSPIDSLSQQITTQDLEASGTR